MDEKSIRTSEEGWVAKLAKAYKDRLRVVLIDDAGTGVNPQIQSLLEIGKAAGLSTKDWIAVLVSLGMSAFGAWMVVAAIMDPEPTSKLSLLVGGGVLLIFCGGWSSIRILTGHKPPKVTVGKGPYGPQFEICWA